MWTTQLTIKDVEARQRQLQQETQIDQAAVTAGKLDAVEALQRSVQREFEQRWLEMEALLLNSKLPTWH